MKLLLGIAAFLVLFLFWACNLGPEDEAVSLNLVGEEAWRSCHTLDVVLLDGTGNVLDTLFSDSLASLDQLERLSARKYTGGKTKVRIRGIHKDGAICVDQLRTYEDGGSLVVDTLLDPAAAPRAVTAIPGNVLLVLNGDEVPVEGRIAPVHADQGLYWSMDSSGVAALDVAPGTVTGKVRLRPVALGEGFLTLRSRKDPTCAARVRIHVSAVAVASVTLDNDSLLLYVGGPGEGLRAVVTPFRADPKVTWSSADPRIARVDAEGLVTAAAAGRTWVRGVSGNGKADSALIVVLDDIPRLVVTAAPGAPVNVPLVFRAQAVQRVGYLTQYAWDFQGDGVWDDSLPGPWFGDSVRLPEIQGTYGAEGGIMASFRVKDSEGNVSYAEVPVEVGNQPPLIQGMPADTVISINDSIPLQAIARDQDGGVA
ncbi:MAG TPA: Ig-like domain-containing protein, partial [Fibrobacteria bacterium]|nr:Ig-like domain-containing protein [Fibrobacteria bacterium]